MLLNNLNSEDVERLYKVIDSCNGKVELVSKDVCINLKSKLSQYFALAKLFSDGEIKDLELRVENPDDVSKFLSFMMGD